MSDPLYSPVAAEDQTGPGGYSLGSSCSLLDVLPAVYDQLRAIARRHLRREQAGHTLQTTAVLHEAYLRLAQDGSRPYADRAEFCVAAARAIRRVLIDHARGRKALKRGGGVAVRVDLDSSLLCTAVASARAWYARALEHVPEDAEPLRARIQRRLDALPPA